MAVKQQVKIKEAGSTAGDKVLAFLDRYIWEILAFILPFVLASYGFYKANMHPFGDRQFLVTDLWHQYYPFFQILQEKLTHGGSLLYTWTSGLGTNFLAIMAYYAASPLNLLSVLMPQDFLRDGMLLILILKFSFAGLFMAKFLHYTFGKNDISITTFGLLYALCSYMMGYYWNTIWIDTVALLPLVMLGLVALVREGKYRTYVVALALALISNYYIAYMICIFTVIAFFLLCLFENVNFKTLAKRFGLITGGSLLGAGIASWILLPAFFALMLTHSANNSFPKETKWYENWVDILSNLLAFNEPTSKEGLPNIYTGLLPLLLLGVFLVAKQIRLREKISGILLMAFILVSCNLNYLNYIWHGFHFTNMLPYRFSFLFSFVLLVAAYRAWQVLLEEKLSLIQWISMIAAGAVFVFLGFRSDYFDDDKFVKYSIYLGVVYLIIVLTRVLAPKNIVQLMLACAVAFEMGWYSASSVVSVGSSSYASYPSGNENIQSLLEIERSMEDELFCRTEITEWYTLNDPSLYYYDGVSQFSSMANESVTTFCRQIGLPASEAGNRYYYANTSPLTNQLLDVQYIMAKDGYSADKFSMSEVGVCGSARLYRVNDPLGFGIMMPEGMGSYRLDDSLSAFQTQNALFKRLTGLTGDLFMQIDITDVGHTGYDVQRRGYGSYNYTRQSGASGETFLKYNYTTVRDGMAYAYMKVTNGDNMDVYYNGSREHRYNIARQPYITPIGSFKSGEKVTLRCDLEEEDNTGTVEVYFYQFNEELYQQGLEILRNRGSVKLTSFSDVGLSADVTASENGVLYLSVPYEAGWRIRVDGQDAELYPIFGAMCAVDLTAGNHQIEMRYSPKGFLPGLGITAGSIVILILLFVFDRKRAGKASTPSEDAQEQPETSEDPETDAKK